MMSLTDEIFRELVEALDSGGPFEPIYEKHKRSKGPLYNALARALGVAVERLKRARDAVAALEAERSRLEGEVGKLKEESQRLSAEVRELEITRDGIREAIRQLGEELRSLDARMVEELAERRARERLEQLKRIEWPAWVEPRAAQLEAEVRAGVLRRLREPWTTTCDKCGTRLQFAPTDENVEALMRGQKVYFKCPRCEHAMGYALRDVLGELLKAKEPRRGYW